MSEYMDNLIEAAVNYYEFRDGDTLEALIKAAIEFGENNEQR